MTEQIKDEIIKSIAAGLSDSEIVGSTLEISVDDCTNIRSEYTKEIADKREELQDMGWL